MMRPDSFGLTFSLVLVFIAFCFLMAGVLAFCLRERRKIDGLNVPLAASPSLQDGLPRSMTAATTKTDSLSGALTNITSGHFTDTENHVKDQAADNRVAMVLFGTIIGGAALALLTGYLVFFRDW